MSKKNIPHKDTEKPPIAHEITGETVVLPIKTVEKIPGRECPYCHSRMECTSTTDLHQVEPEPGNLAVCFVCMEVCKFDEMHGLRKITDDELAALQESPTWEIIRGVRRANEILKILLDLP